MVGIKRYCTDYSVFLIVLWKYSNKRCTRAAALIRGRSLFTFPLYVWCLFEGGAYLLFCFMCGAYSRAGLIYFSALCAALIRGRSLFTCPLYVWRLFEGGAYLLFRFMCGAYSRAELIYFSALCAALNRGRRLIDGGAYSGPGRCLFGGRALIRANTLSAEQ